MNPNAANLANPFTSVAHDIRGNEIAPEEVLRARFARPVFGIDIS
jgi:hypothetical protein